MTTPNKDRGDAFAYKWSEYIIPREHSERISVDCAYFFWQAACADRDKVIAGLQGTIDSMAQTNAALIKKLQANKARGG